MNKKLMVVGLILGALIVSTVSGAFLTYKAYVEIYGYKYPLGQIELETWQMDDIEGLEAREDHVGWMRVYTYSNDSQLVLQLVQESQIVTNFRSFTVKVALDLDMVFVVDTTGSMRTYIETVKTELIRLMRLIDSMHKGDFQVGVVEFRDLPTETRSLALTSDLDAVEANITGLTAAAGGPIPQSHYLGFQRALQLFYDKPASWLHNRQVVFVSDAVPGVNNVFEFAPGGPTQTSVLALEEMGIKVHSVLCGPIPDPTYGTIEAEIFRWYAQVTGGHFVPGPARIVPVVTSNPQWLVKLTPITQFDSFQLPLASSEPTQKQNYYNFSIWVDFYAKAIPWHEWFTTELMAHLEKAEPKPYFPPPEIERERLKILISLGSDPAATVPSGGTITFDWEIIEDPPGLTEPQQVTLEVDGINLYTGSTFPGDFTGTATWTAGAPGDYTVKVTYDYLYLGDPYQSTATHTFTVT